MSNGPTSFVALLRDRALKDGDRIAFRFLTDGETNEVAISYSELDRCARSIAAALQAQAAPGQRALLVYPEGLDYIKGLFGCFYAGVVAVPAYPPGSRHGLARLTAIVRDAQPTTVLTNNPAGFEQVTDAAAAQLLGGRRLDTSCLKDQDEFMWREPQVNGSTLALIQYTSGSTGTPNGVMLNQSNLLHNQHLIQRAFGTNAQTVVAGWLPMFHDMGLIGNILHPVFLGVPCVLMSPKHFTQQPVRWLRAISRYRATTSGGPDFAYDLCVRQIPADQRASLDLSIWQVAFNGSEPVRPATLDGFSSAFGVAGFRRSAFHPCYGLAESTLIVSGRVERTSSITRTFDRASLQCGDARSGDSLPETTQSLVGFGGTLLDQTVLIVEPESATPCGDCHVGEIWVSGPSVAQGYWEKPAATAATFRARLRDAEGGPFLRTGDLGFMDNGDLFITGRLKDLIIIRGRNHYPHDIEHTAELSHHALRPGSGAAFTAEIEGEERLVIVHEVERRYREFDAVEITAAVREAVARQHEIQLYALVLIKSGGTPKTSSGKVQRGACRTAFLAGTLPVLATHILEVAESGGPDTGLLENPGRQWLDSYCREQIAQVLRVSPATIDSQQCLAALGLDSLMVTELQYRLETRLGVVITAATLLQAQSLSRLLDDLFASQPARTPFPAPERVALQETKTAYPLTHGQRALWFVSQVEETRTAYTISRAIRIVADLDIPAMERAWERLGDRHSVLRATFSDDAGEPAQQFAKHGGVRFQVEDASGWSEDCLRAHLSAEVRVRVSIEPGPPVRVALFRRSPAEHVLFLALHHIVADLWSLEVMLRDLVFLYAEEKAGTRASLPLPTLQYADYVRRQSEILAGAEGERLWSYWKKQLAGELAPLSLPADRPRLPIQSYRGGVYSFGLSRDLTEQIRRLAQNAGTTLYTTLLAAFQCLLYRLSDQEDILVGTPMNARTAPELAHLAGYVANLVVLRSNLSGNPAFADFLRSVRATVLDALAHQEYPFSLLVERLAPRRDSSRPPLVQAMFALQKAHLLADGESAALALGEDGGRIQLAGLTFESIALDREFTPFDLSLIMAESEKGLHACFEYSVDLLERETVERFAGYWKTLLGGIVADASVGVRDLPLLSSEDRQRMLVTWNATDQVWPDRQCVHELFEQQAVRSPAAIAASDEHGQWTYEELNRRANQIANYLRGAGVAPETRVGICVEPSLEMLAGVLGILKAGGAYVPLDPAYPKERLAFMLSDARVSVLLTQDRVRQRLPECTARVVTLDRDWPGIAGSSCENPAPIVDGQNLAYVIYTSGSTGAPNGVQIPHLALANLLHSMRMRPGLTERDVLLSVTTLSFDIAGLELFLPITTGARVALVSREVASDGRRLAVAIDSSAATMMQATPATWRMLLETGWRGNQGLTILCGGEALPRDLANRLQNRCRSLWNMYGPTETTIWSAAVRIESTEGAVAIEGPIANTQIYLLDRALRPAPIGVPAELYIGGAGLARGYLDRHGLTAERFIPNPFGLDPGARFYKTGDWARFRSDGSIEYLGRIDYQLKLRGFRIETGEIEAALAQHGDIRESAVVARENDSGEPELIAYVVPRRPEPGPVNGHHPLSEELRQHLLERLPSYMIPSGFVYLDAIPLTPNGKVNRHALASLRRTHAGNAVTQALPCTGEERVLALIWQEVLQISKVGVNENFFDLGGHSLLLARVRAKLEQVYGRDIPMLELLRHPTISSLAQYLGQGPNDQAAVETSDSRAGLRYESSRRRQQLRERRQTKRPLQRAADE